MELYYILYNRVGKSQKYLLVFPLGNKNNKLSVLDTTSLDKSDVSKLRSSVPELSNLSLEGRVNWIKKYIPNAYRNAYREIYDHNYKIISRHEIN